MSEKTVKFLKVVIKNVAGFGIVTICSCLAGSLASSSNAKTIKRLCMSVGGMIIGGMVTKASDEFIDEEIDNAVNFANSLMGSIERVSEVASEPEV